MKILIRSTNWLGDAILTTPSISAIKQHLPEANITIVAKPYVADVFLNNPDVDKILKYAPPTGLLRPFTLLNFVRQLKKEVFDLAILFQNAFEAGLMAFLAGIPKRIGYPTDFRRIFLNYPVKLEQELLKRHQVYYYFQLVKALGIKSEPGELVWKISAEEDLEAKNLLKKNGVIEYNPIIGINPGATFGSAKRWYPDRFAMVADALIDKFRANVIILGSIRERGIAEQVKTLMKNKGINLAGQTDIRTLAAVLQKCHLLITNDSGIMHLAAAVKTPMVAIFGSTDPDTTSPYKVPCRLVRHPVDCSPCLKRECPEDHRCMKLITPDKVFDAAEELIYSYKLF